jgi:hypothetical protein
MPAVLVFKDRTYFVYDGKFQSLYHVKSFKIKMLCLLQGVFIKDSANATIAYNCL